MANEPAPKARIADLFGAAFKDYARGTGYPDLYRKYMGLSWPAPDASACPDWTTVDAAGGLDAALGARDYIRIGVQPTEPYFYMDSARLTGFEYELGNALVDILGRHYDRPGLRGDWVTSAISTPGDGTDNDVLFAEFERRINAGEYDLVFSSIISLDRGDRVAFACNTEVFYIDAVYTGRGDFGSPPTGDVDAAAKFLAVKSRETATTITIVHTAAPDQSKAGRLFAARIRDFGGASEDAAAPLADLREIILSRLAHVYVGDMIQIQRMAMNPGPIDLDINLYTDEHDVPQIFFMAPFGRKV